MTDLAKLREALAKAKRYGILDADSPIMGAARAYADLLENGQQVDWCETHGHLSTGDVNQDLEYSMRQPDHCVIGPKLLIEVPE